jgi:hypothetical protein
VFRCLTGNIQKCRPRGKQTRATGNQPASSIDKCTARTSNASGNRTRVQKLTRLKNLTGLLSRSKRPRCRRRPLRRSDGRLGLAPTRVTAAWTPAPLSQQARTRWDRGLIAVLALWYVTDNHVLFPLRPGLSPPCRIFSSLTKRKKLFGYTRAVLRLFSFYQKRPCGSPVPVENEI